MKLIKTFILTIFLTSALTACDSDSGGNKNTPTNPDTLFNLGNNPSLLQQGIILDLKGKDTNGDSWAAIARTRSLGNTTLNGETVSRVETTVNMTHVPTQTISVNTETAYINSNGRTVQTDSSEGVSCFTQQFGDYPTGTAKIGAFGNSDEMSCSDGTRRTGTWALDDGFNGYANLVITLKMRNASGANISTSVVTAKINTDGVLQHYKQHMTFHEFGESLTLEGSPR